MVNVITVKLDSGATLYYFKTDHQNILQNLKKLENGPLAQFPNNLLVQATYGGNNKLHPSLFQQAQTVLISPDITNKSLSSVS